MTTIEKIKYKNKIIEVSYDLWLEDFDILDHLPEKSEICLSNRRYQFKNTTDIDFEEYSSFEQIKNALEKKYKDYQIIPIYMMDHSGVSFSSCRTCQWDSGQIGYILIPNQTDDEWFDLDMFFEIWTAYSNGHVYQFEILDICPCCDQASNMEDRGVLGGYISIDECVTEAKKSIDFINRKNS